MPAANQSRAGVREHVPRPSTTRWSSRIERSEPGESPDPRRRSAGEWLSAHGRHLEEQGCLVSTGLPNRRGQGHRGCHVAFTAWVALVDPFDGVAAAPSFTS